MSTDTASSYLRATGVLWRDTGSHVVALPWGHTDGVVVLGGGSAQLWRLLHQPRSLGELVEAFVDDQGVRPPATQVAAAMAELVAKGVVSNAAAS